MLLRKPPSNTGKKAKTLKPNIGQRLDQHDSGNWRGLIAYYEENVIAASHLHQVDGRTNDDVKEAKIPAAAEILLHF